MIGNLHLYLVPISMHKLNGIFRSEHLDLQIDHADVVAIHIYSICNDDGYCD